MAIIRPGPIQGGMIHPSFDRRQGRIPLEYPHPSLEDETGMCQPILRPDLFCEHRPRVVGYPALVVEGRLQKEGRHPLDPRGALRADEPGGADPGAA